MLDLRNGTMPPTFNIIDKDQMKEFLYTREGTAKLQTEIGTLDTVIVASRHTANGPASPAHVVRARDWLGTCPCRRSAAATASSSSRCGSRL